MTKTIQVSYTYLDVIEVPEDMSEDEIYDYLEEHAPAPGWNDMEWDECRKPR